MKDITNMDISLCIRENIKNKNIYKKIEINISLLNDYENILKIINDIYFETIVPLNKLKPIEIYLKHPIIQELTIYNKEEWNFLINYNIINECINNNNNKLIIDYQIIKNLDNINKDIKRNNYKKILEYIMGKLPKKFYFKIIFNFFNDNKDIGELFKNYFLNELIKSNLNENEKLEPNIKINNNKYHNNIIYNVINKDKIDYDNDNDNNIINEEKNNIYNKYLMNTEEFLNLLILRYNESLNNINKIINDKDFIEKSEHFDKTNFTDDNNNLKNSIFESCEEKNIKFLSYFNINKDNNILYDENHFFKHFKKEEYYNGIENFKDNLNRELFNIQLTS